MVYVSDINIRENNKKSLPLNNRMTNNKMSSIVFVLFANIFLIGCVTQTPSTQITNQWQSLTIQIGTYFGECSGYCKQDMTITSEKITVQKNGWEKGTSLPEITEYFPISTTQWKTLVDSLDYKKFNALNEVIGCPDCLDGGTEWIEIGDKKVTFEYGSSIPEISNLIYTLREIRTYISSQHKEIK